MPEVCANVDGEPVCMPVDLTIFTDPRQGEVPEPPGDPPGAIDVTGVPMVWSRVTWGAVPDAWPREERLAGDEAIVRRDGQELKVWQSVVEFAAAQPLDAAGEPRIAARFEAPAGRLVAVGAAPLWAWPAGGVVLVLGIAGAAVVARRRRTRAR